MAVRVKLDLINEEQKQLIRKHLYMQPKRTNFVANKFSYVEPDPVLFFWIDKPNNEIVIPYFFALSLFGENLNSKIIYPPGKFQFVGKQREEQKGPNEAAFQHLLQAGTTTLSYPTGFGKSASAAYLSSRLLTETKVGGITLVLTPRETIQKGWDETFRTLTDAKVWVIDSKMKIPTECNVIITMDGKLDKIPMEIRKMVSIFVIDEAHMLATRSQVPVLLGVNPRYIIACTATLERTDGMHSMIQAVVGYHRVEVKNNKKFTVYKLNTGVVTQIVKNKQGTPDFSALSAELAFHPLRNAYIIDFVEKNKHLKVMILTWNKKHVTMLTDIFKQRGESVDQLSGTKSTYVDSRILVGTIAKVSTGFDAKNVAINWDGMNIDTLILAGSTKSFNLHTQSIGRAFRAEHPIIIDMVDKNRISEKHWKERNKIYSEMNCEIIEISLKEDGGATQSAPPATTEDIHSEKLKKYQARSTPVPVPQNVSQKNIPQQNNSQNIPQNISQNISQNIPQNKVEDLHMKRLEALRSKYQK